MVKLELIEKTEGDVFYFRIVESRIEEGCSVHGSSRFGDVVFKSSAMPELYGRHFFVWGTDVSSNNITLTCNEPKMLSILGCIESLWGSQTWMDAFVFYCKECGKQIPYTHHNKHDTFCNDCLENLKVCKNCGNIGAEHKFGGDYYCCHCVAVGTCPVCFGENKITRPREFTIPNDYHGEKRWISMCASCFETDVKIGTEHHYHYRPEKDGVSTLNFWDFKKGHRVQYNVSTIPPKKLFMGVEVEACFPPNSDVNIHLYKIQETYGLKHEALIYAKHDGSIPNPGSEIVTHPMTLAMFHSLTWKGLFDHIIPPIHDGIGGHIHMSKTAFWSMAHTYKMIRFLRTNLMYVAWIAERPIQREWAKARSGNGSSASIAKKYKKNINGDRYEMINFTEHTIELRFFKAPHTSHQLYKNVEFCDALYNFTINAPLHFDVPQFEGYVIENMKEYPHLYNYIRSRGNMDFADNSEDMPNRSSSNSDSYYDDDYDDDYICCDDCGRETNDYVTLDDSHYCMNCVSYCEWCEEYTRDELTPVRVGGYTQYACNVCVGHNFSRCDVCNEYHEDDNTYRTQSGTNICIGCLEVSADFHECSCGNIVANDNNCENGCGDRDETEVD